MDDLTIHHDMHPPAARSPGWLAGLIAARMCHDIVSPLGAVGNGLELLLMSGDFPGIAKSAELQLIQESLAAAGARVRCFRMAFGQGAPDQRLSLAELAALIADLERGGRLRLRLDAQGDLPRPEAQMILLALMCLETAMPWGGSVLICRGARGWRLVAEASRTRCDPALWAWLGGGTVAPSQPAPSEVHFVALATCAAETGRVLHWDLDDQGGEISF
ncbi:MULTISPECIES: histidine phosphotransferase family protein [unclassified Paracoccus (in: a-proteobacteria)]|uniref:histidine phosphotransferase family protein n=1 Tax=unclassified Paracoccus (in: a-proteobacteria) TaxID=2688777 RepID=UPI0012B261FF|nr:MULTISPECIES: histidine phosphotransferase family protein [unclassified Paracoccus (in: a-proteobacteria)]UXU74908.1 histidine phosphotransferase family protein [Paracoccus sp. SMMA_5]UXU80811.1 histidine phosphotransferase family protein [Paracoccus sp. SMMA_5_TC]